jgi:iron(III) transport system substrate-binding protein
LRVSIRPGRPARASLLGPLLVIAAGLVVACGPAQTASPTPVASGPTSTEPAASPSAASGSIVIYAGRSEELVGPLIERFETESGIDVEVNYASTSELAATILEEGDASPADVFFSQDAGALGALAAEGRLAALSGASLDLVDPAFASPEGLWVGVSGRARVAAYNTEALTAAEMPDSILDFTDPSWKGRLGWAPSNASLQSFVTALRVLEGEDAARSWLEGIQANEPKVYEGNGQALEGVASGEVHVAFINHYYLLEALSDGEIPVANHFFPGGDPGSLINVAGAGILTTSKNPGAAQAFIDFLLSEESQAYFAEETYEYPLVAGIAADDRLTPLDEIASPDIDLSDLADLQGTVELMQEVGIL